MRINEIIRESNNHVGESRGRSRTGNWAGSWEAEMLDDPLPASQTKTQAGDVDANKKRKPVSSKIKDDEPQKLNDAKYHGKTVPLNKPMAGDVAKSKVYVKDPSTGNVKKVNFGQKGVRIKKNNPARRKSFRARHNCDNPGPKTKAKYWSCRAW